MSMGQPQEQRISAIDIVDNMTTALGTARAPAWPPRVARPMCAGAGQTAGVDHAPRGRSGNHALHLPVSAGAARDLTGSRRLCRASGSMAAALEQEYEQNLTTRMAVRP